MSSKMGIKIDCKSLNMGVLRKVGWEVPVILKLELPSRAVTAYIALFIHFSYFLTLLGVEKVKEAFNLCDFAAMPKLVSLFACHLSCLFSNSLGAWN